MLSQSWKSDNYRGSNREKSNIAIAILDKWRILSYPISHFNLKGALYEALQGCILDMINIDRQLIRRIYIRHDQYWQTAYPKFWSHKLHKKNDKEIFFVVVYLRKLSRFCGQVPSTSLVIDTFYVKYCSALTQWLNWPPNRDNFLK